MADKRQDVCLRSRWGLEAPDAVKQKIGPGVVGLVAQDGAAGVVGDDSRDGHQLLGYRVMAEYEPVVSLGDPTDEVGPVAELWLVPGGRSSARPPRADRGQL